MESLKEISKEELVVFNGGNQQEEYFPGLAKLNDHWAIKTLNAIGDTIDFFKGIGSGFIQGFNNTLK